MSRTASRALSKVRKGCSLSPGLLSSPSNATQNDVGAARRFPATPGIKPDMPAKSKKIMMEFLTFIMRQRYSGNGGNSRYQNASRGFPFRRPVIDNNSQSNNTATGKKLVIFLWNFKTHIFPIVAHGIFSNLNECFTRAALSTSGCAYKYKCQSSLLTQRQDLLSL